MLLILQRTRTVVTRLFHRFGLHCASHQIRIILISCVVITCLFYPAVAMYWTSQPQSISTSRILHAFVAPDIVSGFYAQQDLVNLWSGYDRLRVRQDAVSRARCGVERTLRVERILIQSPLPEDDGALNHEILLSTLHLEARIQKTISSRHIPCLRKSDGGCFVLSPLAFWNHDKEKLLDDSNIFDTLSLSSNVSVAGIPLTPHMILAGRESNEHGTAKLDSAMFLALTYFFPETDCVDNSEHIAWLAVVENAAAENAALTTQAQEPTLIALEYDPKPKGLTAISALLYLAYTGFFAYVTWSMKHMNGVHSRIGVTFTALVEIAVSTITSLSVCALAGFQITMVPWELLPIVIVFVGAENMFNLADAVGKTSVTLSVKQRIAEGLSRAGTSNTLKVVSYNSILGVISVLSAGAIRQFCAFAIVVLVAHWFLAHTFFVAVLSIDLQRLELDELIRHNSGLGHTAQDTSSGGGMTQRPASRWKKWALITRNILNGRAKKNISLLMLLAITATLYYTTYPASTQNNGSLQSSPRLALARGRPNGTIPEQRSPALHLWNFLNPQEDHLLHLRLEVPTILTFWPHDDVDQLANHKAHRPRSAVVTFRLTFRLAFWLLKIIVLPIAATTSVLYVLLLYLLQNADLLEAQRSRPDPESSDQADETTLEGRASFSTLPRAFATDVELIASSKDGKVVASVGVQNEITIWHMDDRSHISIDATDILLRAASTSSAPSTLTAIAVDDKGEFCAVGTGAGIAAVWSVHKHHIEPLPHLFLENFSSAVIDLHFISQNHPVPGRDTPPQSGTSSPVEHFPRASLVVIHKHGLVTKWDIGSLPVVSYLAASQPTKVLRANLLRVQGDTQLMVAFCLDDGSIELAGVEDMDALVCSSIPAGTQDDIVSRVHACRSTLNGRRCLVIGAATESGVISLWDGVTGECITVLENTFGKVNNLRISPVLCELCHTCGELPMESLSIAFSVDHIVHFFKVYLSLRTRRCSCPNNQPPRRRNSWDSLGRRSRSSSLASPMGSPSHNRLRLASSFESPSFPVSAHGVHSRKVTDSGRRAPEALFIPLPEEYDSARSAGLPSEAPKNSALTSPYPSPSIWQKVIVATVMDTICHRGSWDVSGHKVIGVRRKPRSLGSMKGRASSALTGQAHGLTAAVMDRWELWIYDPSSSRLQSSSLAALETSEESSTKATLRPISEDSTPQLPFTRASPFLIARVYGLAGFGNTVGVFDLSLLI